MLQSIPICLKTANWTVTFSPLIYAYNCKNIAITGTGTLEPEMETWRIWFEQTETHMQALKTLYDMMSTGVPVEERRMAKEENHLRPQLIQFNRCENVLLDGFKIRESPFWTIHMLLCNNGIVRNLDVKAHGHNNDGIDIEMSSNFLVEKCTFDQGDDAIVIKAGRNQDGWRLNKPSENIVIRNCEILKGNTLLGIGSELSAGVRNVYLHDCKTPQYVYRLFQIKTNHRRGGFVNNIYLENIEADRVERGLLEIDTDVFYQWRDLVQTYEVRLTTIGDINLRNINCNEAALVYYINGDPGNPIGTVTLENIHVEKIKEQVKDTKNTTIINETNVTTGNQ